MPYGIEEFGTHLWGKAAIISKTVKLLDYLITSTVHAGFPKFISMDDNTQNSPITSPKWGKQVACVSLVTNKQHNS